MTGTQLTVVSASDIDELIDAALLMARVETRVRISRGEDEKVVTHEILSRLQSSIETESYGRITDDALPSAVQAAIAAVIAEMKGSRARPQRSSRWATGGNSVFNANLVAEETAGKSSAWRCLASPQDHLQ